MRMQAVRGEVELANDRRVEPDAVREGRATESRRELQRRGTSTDAPGLLEHERLQSRPGEHGGRDEPVVAGSNN
jgi:hypothetical protein